MRDPDAQGGGRSKPASLYVIAQNIDGMKVKRWAYADFYTRHPVRGEVRMVIMLCLN